MVADSIPIFPLKTVLFPDGLLPLRIFEARYLDMASQCMRAGTAFGVCLIVRGEEVGSPAEPAAVGCLARIREWDMAQFGVLNLLTQGQQRFRLISCQSEQNGLLRGEIEVIEPDPLYPVSSTDTLCVRVLRSLLGELDERLVARPHRYDDGVWVGNRLAELLPLPLPMKQELMELNDSGKRLDLLREALEKASAA